MTILPVRRRQSGYRMNPFLLLNRLFCASIEVGPCQRPRGALVPGKDDLKQLQTANTKSGNGAGQVQAPHARKPRSKRLHHGLIRLLKPAEPMLQRFRVMGAQILHMKHAKILRFKHVHGFLQARRIGPGENAFPYPYAECPWVIPAYEMQQAAAAITDGPMNHASELKVVLGSQVLEHADGDKYVKAAADVAAVVFDKLHA